MKSLLAVAVLCFIMPGISQLSNSLCAKNPDNVAVNKSNWDTVTVRNIAIKKDTIIIRPIYKLSNEILERLVDSFCIIDCYLDDIVFFKNVNNPQMFIISSSTDINSIESVKGIYRTWRPITIYGINDSILDGFYFDKTPDSIYVKLTQQDFPICRPDYFIHLKAKKRENTQLSLIVNRSNKPIDYDKCDQLRWLNDYITSRDTISSSAE